MLSPLKYTLVHCLKVVRLHRIELCIIVTWGFVSGKVFQKNKCGWVGWMIPKRVQSPRKFPFCDPNYTFGFPKSPTKTLVWVGELVHTFRKTVPKKHFFWGGKVPKKVLLFGKVFLDMGGWNGWPA